MERVKVTIEPKLHRDRYVVIVTTAKASAQFSAKNKKEVRAIRMGSSKGARVNVFEVRYNFIEAWVNNDKTKEKKNG